MGHDGRRELLGGRFDFEAAHVSKRRVFIDGGSERASAERGRWVVTAASSSADIHAAHADRDGVRVARARHVERREQPG